MRMNVPENVKNIIAVLEAHGFEAYAVGGCVRDTLLLRVPGDWDITTSAKPEEVKRLFSHTIDTGIEHGTVTVMLDKTGYEVTTYRIDGKYEDGRHPEEVTFTPNLEEDLKRRDFTINAMAYNEQDGLIDLFGGIRDIQAKIIRCVGDPIARFNEDALRIMRAIRFAAQLGYDIDSETKQAIKELAPNLKKISAERIQVELTKLVVSAHPEALRTVYETGVADVIMPELAAIMETQQNHPHHNYSVGEHTIRAMLKVEGRKELRFAMLFHDMGKPLCLTTDEQGISHFYGHAQHSTEIAGKILRRLRFDNDTIHTVCRLVQYHDYGNNVYPDRRIVRRAMNKIGEDLFPLLFEVKKADILAQSDNFREEKLERLAKWQELYAQILQLEECVSLKTLAVTGSDLIALGMKPGKELGDALQELLELVLDQPECNTKEYLSWIISQRK